MTPLELNLLIATGVIIFFLVQGLLSFKKWESEDQYFLRDRNLNTNEYSYSFAAASTSLATVLFFFTILGLDFGLYIFYAPLTYFIGVFFFNRFLLPKIQEQGFFNDISVSSSNVSAIGTTLGNYLMHRLNSRLIKNTVLILTLLGMFSILLIELYVGVTIFSVYIKPEYSYYALIVLTLVVFIYTGLGGFEAVVKTDKYQYKLILYATLIFLSWLIIEIFEKSHSLKLDDFFVPLLPLDKGILLPYPLLANIVIVNVLLIPAMLRTWQLLAASKNLETVRKGNWIGALKTFILTAAFVFVGIVFFKYIFPIESDEGKASLIMMFNKLQSFPDYIGPYFVFPVFFGACLAALISTADSALLPITQSLVQDFRKNTTETKISFWKIIGLSLVLITITLLLYFIVFKVLNYDLINWLFTIFSLLIINSPLIIFTIVADEKLLKKRRTHIFLFIILVLGFLIAIGLSYYGNKIGDPNLVMLNSPISCGIIGLLYFIYYKLNQTKL